MKITETSVQEEIQELMSEGRAGAVARERRTFDEIVGPRGRSLVLFGAGNLGRRTLNGLRQLGIEPLAFADNNPALWDKPMLNIPVLSPQAAVAKYGKDAAFVVTIWCGEGHDRMGERIQSLRALGCDSVVSFGPLFWKYPEIFLPHYAAAPAHWVHEQAGAVLDAANLWADEASMREYLSQIRWRLLFDFDGLADPVQHEIYFPGDLCSLTANETFVDCGAFDGDTVSSFLAQSKSRFGKVIAFEPDPASFAKLQQRVFGMAEKDRIELHQAATGAENCVVRFSGDGTPAAKVGAGSLEVNCVKLDDALADEEPTYLKMDIEGAEPDALMGARRTIEKYCPVLAICSYHRQDHVWTIPRLIKSFHPDYRFFLRPHLREVWDLVCYAIPKRRLK